MLRKPSAAVDESNLTKGQQRKLTALRKSLGLEIADRAFSEWLASEQPSTGESRDSNAELIVDTLTPLAMSGKLKIPRGGYILRRGRGRVIIERPS